MTGRAHVLPLSTPAAGVEHFAPFPVQWPRRLILGWSPPGICTGCGHPRVPVTGAGRSVRSFRAKVGAYNRHQSGQQAGKSRTVDNTVATDIRHAGYACRCATPDHDTSPAVVVDPFGGSGTTALAAAVLGRVGISIDLSFDYSALATWRVTDPDQVAHAMGVPKPPRLTTGQVPLFDAPEVSHVGPL